MGSNPVQNVNYFMKRRPPLVIFTLCLVALAVSTFYFAFEIESEAKTLDSDKKHDWKQMVKHFNKLKSCLLPIAEAENQLKNIPATENFSVFTQLEIKNTESLQKLSIIRGILTLDEWYPTNCGKDHVSPKNVAIYFKVPSGITINNATITVCAEIRGPADILPKFASPICIVDKATNPKEDGFLTTYLSKNFDTGFCARGETAKIEFIMKQIKIDNYIDDDIRIRIYTHLIWCSYVLVFFIFCIILYAIFYKDQEMKKELGLRLL